MLYQVTVWRVPVPIPHQELLRRILEFYFTSSFQHGDGPSITPELSQTRRDNPVSDYLANATRSAQLLLNLGSVIPIPYTKIVGGVALSIFSSIQASYLVLITVDSIYFLSKSKTTETTMKNW
jgi:hypothetical protein